MPSEIFEHNRLDQHAAAAAARDLIRLFDSTEIPPLSAGDTVGAPPLVENIDDIPKQSIELTAGTIPIYAVDGGSSVLAKGGNIELIAWRAGMVCFEGSRRVAEECPPPEILAFNRLNAAEQLREYLLDQPIETTDDKPVFRLVDELRHISEWRLAEKIIDESETASILLMDGALRASPALDMAFEKRILQKAAAKSVHVAAVTKETRLSANYVVPLDMNASSKTDDEKVWYRKISKPMPPESIWLGDVYQARLHDLADKLYLIHVNRFDTGGEKRLPAGLAAVSDDVEFAGYPYPLAAAHRLARIDNVFRGEMLDSLERALDHGGFSSELWDYLKGDIHIKLNADLTAMIGGRVS